MLDSRQLGAPTQTAVQTYVDQQVAPPTSSDPVIYRLGNQLFFRDTEGNERPLVNSADGAGIVELEGADSPYNVLPPDTLIKADSATGAITIKLPAAGGPYDGRKLRVIRLGANNIVLDGNGNTINGGATLTLSALRQVREVTWVKAFGAVTGEWIVTDSVG